MREPCGLLFGELRPRIGTPRTVFGYIGIAQATRHATLVDVFGYRPRVRSGPP